MDLHSPAKSSTRYRVSGGGLKHAQEKVLWRGGGEKKKRKILLFLDIDPFQTVESVEEQFINMIPMWVHFSNPQSGG